MINVAELITDPDFAQSFKVYRSIGQWDEHGRFTTITETLVMTGAIQPMTTKELQQIPAGDQVTGGINVWTLCPIYTTELNQNRTTKGNLSDQIEWHCQKWKILSVKQFSDYGYWRAQCVQLLGA